MLLIEFTYIPSFSENSLTSQLIFNSEYLVNLLDDLWGWCVSVKKKKKPTHSLILFPLGVGESMSPAFESEWAGDSALINGIQQKSH